MTYVRMTRPLKRPMRVVALTDHLPRVRSVYESSTAECSWPFSKPAHPPRSAPQAAALRSVPRGTGPDVRLVHVS